VFSKNHKYKNNPILIKENVREKGNEESKVETSSSEQSSKRAAVACGGYLVFTRMEPILAGFL